MDSRIKKLLSNRRSVFLAAAVVVAAMMVYVFFLRPKAAAYSYFTEPVQRGPIRNVVNATGTVQAVLTVQVGSQVTGQIQTLYADYNSIVKRGQLLAMIDPRTYEAQVEQAKANLLAAQARVQTADADLKNQMASLENVKANLEVTRVARDNTAVIFGRYTELQQGGVVSQNDYDTAKANSESAAAKYAQAEAQVEQAEAQVNSNRAQVEQAKAQVEQARAALNQSQVNLDFTSIISPVDGVVISRSVDVGQTVSASLQTPTLFVIANDLTQMQVNANIDEADIGSISYDSEARFTVDAYPNRTFTGRIAEIRLNPQTIQNVVTYNVILNVHNERLELKPGMTSNLTITVAQQGDVVKVPNAALRYLPPGTTREQVQAMLRQPPETKGASSTEAGGSAPDAGETTQAAGPEPARDRGKTAPPAETADLSPEQRQTRSRPMQGLSGEERGGAGGRFQRPGAGGGEVGRSPELQASLAPGQKWDPEEKIQFPTLRQRSARPGILWVLGPGNKPDPRRVSLGITDGSATQVISGGVQEGEKVIIGDTSQSAAPSPGGSSARMPFMGFGRR